jgi:hypothetical protein
MALFRQTVFRLAALAGLEVALAAAPAFAQPPAPAVYTYNYGYNPGYYGSSVRPSDSGSKPGQAIVSPAQYWGVSRGPQPQQGAPGARPPQSR